MFLEFERNCLKSCQSGDLKLAFKLGAIWESVEVIDLQRKGTLFCTKSQVLLASKGHMLFFKAQLHFPTQLPDEENDSPDFSPRIFTF